MKRSTRLLLLSAAPVPAAQLDSTVVLGARVMTKAAADAEPPTEFMLWPYGTVETTKGNFTLTKELADSIVEKVAERGNELAFDYEHATFNPADNGPVPAAGWHGIEARDDGLYAVNVQWTKKAYDMIKSRELRYFSPAVEINDALEVVDYLNTALTNLPATKNLKPLVASARVRAGAGDFRTLVTASSLSYNEVTSELSRLIRSAYSLNGDDWSTWVQEVYDDYVIFERKSKLYKVGYSIGGTPETVTLDGEAVEVKRTYSEVEGGAIMKTLLLTLGLAQTATEAEALPVATEAMQSRSQLLTLTGAKTVAEAQGIVQAWKANSEKLPEVQAELNGIKDNADAEERKRLVASGIKDGKIPPATKEYWESQPTESVKQFLSAVMPTVPVKEAPKDGSPAAPETKTAEGADDGANVAKMFGHTPGAVQEFKQKKGGN